VEPSNSTPVKSKPKDYWGSVVQNWRSSERYSLWRKHSDDVNTKLLDRWLAQNQLESILKTDLFDEAVSVGLSKSLLRLAPGITGIDISLEVARAAKVRNSHLNVQTADVRFLPYRDSSFDAIVSLSTLDHFNSLTDIQLAINELCRVLRYGGVMVITLDNLSNPLIWLRNTLPDNMLIATGLIPYETGKTCTRKTLEKLCNNAGLKVEHSTALLHCPRVFAVALSRLIENADLSDTAKRRYLRLLTLFEAMEHWPTKFITGYFTAICVSKT